MTEDHGRDTMTLEYGLVYYSTPGMLHRTTCSFLLAFKSPAGRVCGGHVTDPVQRNEIRVISKRRAPNQGILDEP